MLFFQLIATLEAVSISQLLLENYKKQYPNLEIEKNVDKKALMTSMIAPEMRQFFGPRNSTQNFLQMIDPRNSEVAWNVQSVNLIHSMIVLDVKDKQFPEAETLVDTIIENPLGHSTKNPMLSVLQGTVVKTPKIFKVIFNPIFSL